MDVRTSEKQSELLKWMHQSSIISGTDSYKLSHFNQMPKGTEYTYYYLESRGGQFKETVFFGLQYILKNLQRSIFHRWDVEEAGVYTKLHGVPFNYEGWENLWNKYQNNLPLRIRAVKEGLSIPTGNVLVTVENTDPEFFWLPGHFEGRLMKLWDPITICTASRECKKVIMKYLEETGDVSGLPFKLHDFGYRGVSSEESAGIGGMAHLVNFQGTDTIPGIVYAHNNYSSGVCGYSIPAMEHGTVIPWGEDGEVDAYSNMLDQYPEGLVACVSDSYNIYNALENIWGGVLKERVMNRNGTVVIRLDSGEPVSEVLKALDILTKKFGYTVNEKGYKVLPPQVRILQGDGIDLQMIEDILWNMKRKKYSADNIAFGSGGGLLQKWNRDTCKFAMKMSSICINGEWRDVCKHPIADKGKSSKKGRFSLIKENGIYKTVPFGAENDLLETVYENGKFLKEYTFDEVRRTADSNSFDLSRNWKDDLKQYVKLLV